jgi:dual specificity MAP kinase phosphatase
MESVRLDKPFGVKYYLWLPVKDHQAPTQEQLMVGVDFIDTLVSRKIKIYIHCKNGHGRSPTLVAAYLIATKGMTVDQAVKYIEKRRPSIHLEKVQYAALKKFERFVRRG